jgi:hypothetical protein
VAGWIGGNLLAAALHFRPVDPPPFAWLGEAALVGLACLRTKTTTSLQNEFRTAFAKPLISLLSVTALAWAFTSSLV